MNADLDAFATELYVAIDDILIANPHLVPHRPKVGIAPRLADAELLTLAVLQALLGYSNEARFIRDAHTHLSGLFPYLPNRPAYNKRLRHSVAMLQGVTRILATRCAGGTHLLGPDHSTPDPCSTAVRHLRVEHHLGHHGDVNLEDTRTVGFRFHGHLLR